jgi:uncharacterized protein UPF0259
MPDGEPARTVASAVRPMGIGAILATALELYRRRWRTLLGVVAVAAPVAVSLPSTGAIPLQAGQFHVVVHHRVVAAAGSGMVAVLGVLTAVVALLGLAVVAGAVVRAAAAAAAGEDLGVGRSYRYGVGHLWPLTQVLLLTWLLTGLGIVLLVVPGVIVGVLLSVSVPALVVEGGRGLDALARSWDLVKGRWRHTFGTIVCTWLLLGLVVNLVVNGVERLGDGWLAQTVAQALAITLATPFAALVGVLLHLDLRARAAITRDGA